MTYEELKKIAQPHIRNGAELPSNSFLLLTQLHIPFKDENQCKVDYNGKMTPLYNTPAFLKIDSDGSKTIYFKTNTKYWNFYIFHEIAHFLLGHIDDCPQNEMDADMLACILAAPIENFPSTIKSAKDISSLCQIPIDKAEMYWQEIKPIILKQKFPRRAVIISSAFLILVSVIGIRFMGTGKPAPTSNDTYNTEKSSINSTNEIQHTENIDYVVVTTNGKKYHLPSCRYVKNKTNTIEYSISEAIDEGYTPCKVCMK